MIGFSEYFPSLGLGGLREVYTAASTSLNQILNPRRDRSQHQGQLSSPQKRPTAQQSTNSAAPMIESDGRKMTQGSGMNEQMIDGERRQDISRSRYRLINIHPGAMPRQQSTESAYVGSKTFQLASGPHLSSGLARSAGKSSGSTCRKTATYQN